VTREESELLAEVSELAELDRKAAIGMLRESVDEDSSAALEFALGVLLAREGKLDEAEAAYLAASRRFPRFLRAHANLGRLRLSRGRAREAAAAFRAALRLDPGRSGLWKLLGYCYLQAERLAAAESAYRLAHALDPEDPETATGLAQALISQGGHSEALPLARELLEREPLRGELWRVRANAHLEAGREREALEALESARRLGALDVRGGLALADLCYNHRLYDEAVERYEEAFETGEVAPSRVLRSAEAMLHAARARDAARWLERVRDAEGVDRGRLYLLQGRLAEERGELESAAGSYEKALEHDPLSGEALLALGELRRRRGELDRAALAFERASRLEGFAFSALLELARIDVERGAYARAAGHLESALARKSSPAVERYLEQVRRLARAAGGGPGR
jgi:tetratricopeptide (TPR) repeat protein